MLALHEGVRRRARDRATRSAAASPRSRSCTRRPGSGTRSARSRPRASTARRSSSSSASRTGGTSSSSRSSPGGCAGLAGDYPVWVEQPVRAAGRARRDRARVPRGRDARAGRRSSSCRWTTGPRRRTRTARTPRRERVVRAAAADAARGRRARGAARATRERRRSSSAPAPTTGRRGRRSSRSPSGSSRRCTRSRSARGPASRRTTALFAGFLPADRPRLRETLAPYDAVLVVGAPVFRQSPYARGPLRRAGDAARARHATTRTRCTAAPAELARARRRRPRSAASSRERVAAARRRAARAVPPAARAAAAPGEPLTRRATSSRRSPSGCRATPSSSRRRPSTGRSCTTALPAREPLGFVSAAMGGLGFALAGATGVRMALPERPVVAVRRRRLVALRHPGALERGALRRRRPLRDPLERRLRDHGPARRARAAATPPWPGFGEVDVAALARGARLRGAPDRDARRARRGARRGRADARDARRARSCSTSVIAPDADVRAVRRESVARPEGASGRLKIRVEPRPCRPS